MAKRFSFASVERRRREFTEHFAIERLGFAAGKGRKLKPFLDSFPIELYRSDFSAIWSDRRFDWLAFGWLAHLFEERDLLDHAWTMVFATKPCEPWVLVSEPYHPDPFEVVALRKYLAQIGMELAEYPSDQSPWNPGGTTPLVAYAPPHSSIDGLFGDAARQIAMACHAGDHALFEAAG